MASQKYQSIFPRASTAWISKSCTKLTKMRKVSFPENSSTRINKKLLTDACLESSVADPDPGPFYPKDPGSGSGIRDDFFSGSRIPDPGSRIPDPYYDPNSRFYL
jgi:hypothetical protein